MTVARARRGTDCPFTCTWGSVPGRSDSGGTHRLPFRVGVVLCPFASRMTASGSFLASKDPGLAESMEASEK